MAKKITDVEKLLWNDYFKSKSAKKRDRLFMYYKTWAEKVYSKRYNKNRGMDYFEEFLPEVYIALLNAIQHYKRGKGAAFRTFAYAFIVNQLFNARRPFLKTDATFRFVENPAKYDAVEDCAVDSTIAANDEKFKMIRTLNEWGYEYKEVLCFICKYFSFMSTKEICERTGFSQTKVFELLSHMRKDLLDEYGDLYKNLLSTKFE